MRELLERHPDYLLVFVYGIEAHAQDGHGNDVDRSDSARRDAAERIQEFFGTRAVVLVDRDWDGSAQRLYGAGPNTILFFDREGRVRVKEWMADLHALARDHPEFE